MVGGLGVCASGVGTAACAVGAIGAVASGNHLYGDVQQAVTGNEARSALVQALTANGISATDATKYQAYIDAGVVVVSLGVAGGQAVYRFTVNSAKVNAADRATLDVLTSPNVPRTTAANKTVRVDTSRVTRGTTEYEALNNPKPNTTTELSNGTTFKTGAGGYVERSPTDRRTVPARVIHVKQ